MIDAKNKSHYIWVHFNGDVAVGPNHGKLDEKPVAILSLQNLNGKWDIGDLIEKDKNVSILSGPRVDLTFNKPESIDVVISALKRAKKMLIREEKVIPNPTVGKK